MLKNGPHYPQPCGRTIVFDPKPIKPSRGQFYHNQGGRGRSCGQSVSQGNGVGVVVGLGVAIPHRNSGEEPFEQFASVEVRGGGVRTSVGVMVRMGRGQSCLKQDEGYRQ